MPPKPVQLLKCVAGMKSPARSPPVGTSILPPPPRVHALHDPLKTPSRLTVAPPTGQLDNTGRSLHAASIVRGPSGSTGIVAYYLLCSGRWHTTATAHLYKLGREGER